MKMPINHAVRHAVFAGAALASLALASAAPAGQSYTVTMANMGYGRIPTGLKVGDSVVWVNHDTVLHTVTARDHSFDLRIAPGKSATLTLQKSGNIAFYCIFHAQMRGTLTVAA